MSRPKRIFTEKEKKLIVAFYKEGKINQEVADIIGVPRQTLEYHLKTNGLVSTIKKAKEIPNKKVEKALFRRALGYRYDEIRIENTTKSHGKIITTKEIFPEVAACIFWLCNRSPEKWRNRQEIEHKGVGITISQLVQIVNGNNGNNNDKQARVQTGERFGNEVL